jgi:nitroreductase
MDFEEIVYKRRTIRRFRQESIDLNTLKKLTDFARVAPMARNIQAIEFIIVHNPEMREKMFPLVNWAGSLPPEQRTPEHGREPTAYIVVLLNTNIKSTYVDFDVGAAVENILLGAVNYGIGSCWMGSIDRNKIRKLLDVPDYYDIKHVISLGYPDENSIIESYENSFVYWKSSDGQIHVPKRSLKSILFKIF